MSFILRRAQVAAASLVAGFVLFQPTEAQVLRQPHVAVELVSSMSTVAPGSKLVVALRIVSDSGWHTYWKNPGDAGSPPTIEWRVPQGFTAGALRWPVPEVITSGGVVTFGYTGEVLLPVEIQVPREIPPTGSITLGAEVRWVVCRTECVAGEASLRKEMTVFSPAPPDPKWGERLAAVVRGLPAPDPDWKVSARATDSGYVLEIVPPAGHPGPIDGLRFLPDRDVVIDHAAPQVQSAIGSGGYRLTVVKSQYGDRVQRLTGLLIAAKGVAKPDGPQAIEIDVPVQTADSNGSRMGIGRLANLSSFPMWTYGGISPMRFGSLMSVGGTFVRRGGSATAGRRVATAGLVVVALAGSPSRVGPEIGKPAPAFKGTSSAGKEISLADYKGKWVVLEWVNHECPYVRKHYGAKNMQQLQKTYTDKGVVWLSINSSAPGQQGYVEGAAADSLTKEKGAAPSAVILDPKGTIGHAYDARNTPHLFVINPEGILLYDGAIDDKPTADPNDIQSAKNYLAAALDEAMAGKKVTVSKTKPYGCTVKYSE